MGFSRRTLLKNAVLAAAARTGSLIQPKSFASSRVLQPIPSAKFQANWDSLKQYKTPEWFRDAKFGIWAHWSAQCVPEQGDWYARQMYIQGHPQYEFHVRNYGHPTRFGFMDVDHIWKAERWQPEQLLDLYQKTGARYFMALACHHDNLDCFDSTHHSWNTIRVGPGKDIVGIWAKLVRERGLRFAVSNHASHAWHWLQTAYDYDPEGPLAGQRYDAFTRFAADGTGKWWNGLDPQQLYTGRNVVMPDGIKTIKDANAWHDSHDRVWNEAPPQMNPAFTRAWFLRCKELVDKYQPDLLYFDDEELPLGQAGLDIAAYYYNANMSWNQGRLEAVITSKKLTPNHLGATVLDIERGRAQGILNDPWQTDTCIGDWHYSRQIFLERKYKTPSWVAQSLVDIVSKNGNLMLNIPMRGDGTIDEEEYSFLDELGRWMRTNGEAIYSSRPFTVYGEGAPDVTNSNNFNETAARAFNSSDIRFTTKGDQLYVFALGWPENGKLVIKSLAKNSSVYPPKIAGVEMLGLPGRLNFRQTDSAMEITLPSKPQGSINAYSFKVLS
jgi:alpha-L-fucosidase